MKKTIVFLLAVILLVSTTPATYATSGTLDSFKAVRTYPDGRFSDVPSAAWYIDYVKAAYSADLCGGIGGSSPAADNR